MAFSEYTIADLRHVAAGNGDDALVAGYHVVGDLGGGTFHFEGPPPRAATVAGVGANDAVITNASDTVPIQITTSAKNTYATGQAVLIKGVAGNSNANGTWIITVNNGSQFTLNGSSGNAAYTSGGQAHATTISTVDPHGLVSSQQVMVAGIVGTTNANGTWRATVISGNSFSIPALAKAVWISGGLIGDGGIFIPSQVANGRWRRIYSDAFNVRWFGATGDGKSDDTTSIQGALCAAGSGYHVDALGSVFGGGKLHFPAGTYVVAAPLNVPEGVTNSNIVIEGAGQDNTILKGYGYYFPIIQSVWGNLQTVRTFLSVRDLTIASDPAGELAPVWSPNTPYSKGTVTTSGLSNRLLQCTSSTGKSGLHPPFGNLWSGTLSDPLVWITGTPAKAYQQVIILVESTGPVGVATFIWSTDGAQTFSSVIPSAASVVLGATGLTAHFTAGIYAGSRYYCSPPMGYGFSTVHDTTVTDNAVEWVVIDGGCGILQVNGGEICVERVHFVGVTVGIIFDGTEISAVRDCTFDCANGIWITGGNQRQNNSALDTDASIDQSNVNSVEDCWFDCTQLSFAAEGNLGISLSGANFEAGQWYGWTTGVVLLKVSNITTEGGSNGWFVGSLAPFNGNASYPTTNALFENCLIAPSGGTGPAVQASNYAPAAGGFQALGTPFERLSFINCYLSSKGKYVFVGMGTGNGYRVVDTIWGGGAPFDASSLATLSEYSDASLAATGYGMVGYGCVPQAGLDLNRSLALRSVAMALVNGVNIDVANPYRPCAEISGPSAPFSLSGITGGTEGQVIEIVNLSGQPMTINHEDSKFELTPANQFLCSNGAGLTLAWAPGGFNWVRVRYSASLSKWLVLDHS